MPSLQEYIALGEYETGLSQSKDDQEEIIRLPLLLRLLAQSQDDLECLEDRAAKFSQAEHIHVLACHLAPAVCRAWKRSFSGKSRKRKIIVEQEGDDDDDDGDILMKVEETEEQQEESAGVNEAMNIEETPLGSAEMEDSLEVVLQHTLQELYTKSQSNTAVLSEDSILFQPTGGAVLASLMHYAPQLRHKKVAQLIVRSGHCEQYLLKCLAVNCPAAQYTLESVLPGFMGDYEDDLDAVACDWIANPAMIQATEQVGNLMHELAKAPSNILYCKALVWAMIQLNRHVMETWLTGVSLLVATVLAVTAPGNDCDTLLQRLYQSETDEQILFVLHHRDDLLRLVATFLDVPEIVNEHFLDCTRTFERTKMNCQATNQVWKNPIVILQSWKAGDGVEKYAVVEILKLYVESQTHAEELAKSPIAADLFSTGVALVEDPVPLVHAIALERMCLTSRVDSPLFQIRLLYCFAFLETHPGSPFCFNPRNLPLRQILLMAESLSWGHALVRHIQNACSETIHIARYFRSCHVVDGNEQIRTKRSLQQVVKCAVLNMDDDGQAAESAFLDAAKVLSDSDLTTTTVASLLARKGMPLPFLTYSMLYNDPLCILKCPLTLWNRSGLRRLILFILQLLLEVNGAIVWKKARTPEVAAEYIVSRDLVVLHCVLGLVTNSRTKTACLTCELIRAFVRKTVAQHRGLVALLVRQDVSEEILDWLVEWVPETICDGLHIQQLLCDRNQWTSPASRLIAADFCVRIAIAHGHRFVKESSSMVGTALSVLLSSFFIILGPVGVSVDASRGGEGNVDVTHTCRKAAFRLLRATHKTRLYRRMLRAEILPALQKLIGMCKGEVIVGTLPTSTTGKQKSFLNDFSDAVAKSIEMMGGV